MKTVLTIVMPEYAKLVLEKNNIGNRRISPHTVDLFAREMQGGRWGVTHQGIAFYKDGTLADGQHRLAAVVKSGCDVKMMVTHGVDRESSMHMDTGRGRSINDIIKISGQADWLKPKMTPVVKLVYLVGKVSADEMLLLAEPIKDSLLFVDGVMNIKSKGVTASLRAALVLAHHSGASEVRLAEFAEMFYSGIVKSESDTAVIKIRDLLMITKGRSLGYSERLLDLNKAMVAIDKFLKHQPVKLLRPTADFLYPPLNAADIINRGQI